LTEQITFLRVAASAPVRQRNANAKLDKFTVFEKVTARVAG